MKKTTIFVLLMISCFILSACGVDKADTKDDDDFIAAMGKALEARWSLLETDEEFYSLKNNEEPYSVLIQAELDVLGSYEDYTFQDEVLAEYARQYFEALDMQMEGLKYKYEDYDKYNHLFNEEGHSRRMRLIVIFVEDYGMTVSVDNQVVLKDSMEDAEAEE